MQRATSSNNILLTYVIQDVTTTLHKLHLFFNHYEEQFAISGQRPKQTYRVKKKKKLFD